MGRFGGFLAGIAALSLVAGNLFAGSAAATPGDQVRCSVTSGRDLERAAPEQVGLDSGKLREALTFAAGRNRFNVQVFRHNCLIGEGPTNGQTGNVAWNIWSSTKSVVSLLAGIASDQGKLDLDAPIDRYLPAGLGDAAHRSITVENLLTETSGMRVGVLTEGVTGVIPVDPDSAVQALGVPLDNPPGTVFTYSQRNVDLLAYVLELAVGEPLQAFAQRELFDPLGILRSDYYWARDRSGHTYGYAHLMIPPNDFAKLGLLVSNDGRWGGQQLVSLDYLRKARTPSPTNACYGYLFWLGSGCAEIADFLPDDVYAMAGLGLQERLRHPEPRSHGGVDGRLRQRQQPGRVRGRAEHSGVALRVLPQGVRRVRQPSGARPGPVRRAAAATGPSPLRRRGHPDRGLRARPSRLPGVQRLRLLESPAGPAVRGHRAGVRHPGLPRARSAHPRHPLNDRAIAIRRRTDP
nr:serine hydrolase [Nocardia beijingensis]